MDRIRSVAIEQIKLNSRNAKTHSKKQIGQIARSIGEFGFRGAVLIDEDGVLICGEGRVLAAKQLGLSNVPAITVAGLSEAKKRALALADNKIAENGGWDRQRLALELTELSELLIEEDLDISVVGFEAAEIDQLHADFGDRQPDPEDELHASSILGPPVARAGDLWALAGHRVLCGDARNQSDLAILMQAKQAAMACLDPPYNVAASTIGGRGRVKHANFAMARGEMSRAEYITFLRQTLGQAAAASRNGAVHFVFSDWRHVAELIEAGRAVYGGTLNLVVWDKTNAGQGSMYRSQHELIGVFKVGDGKHLNNIQQGRYGRNRSNVWRYAGVNTFRAGRMDDLKAHPTVKPVGLVRDAILDTTRRGDLVIDTFCGAGTTVLAAERTGRCAYAIEIEPRYVDVTVRRWQEFTRKDAIHEETGETFDERAARLTAAPSRRSGSPRRSRKE